MAWNSGNPIDLDLIWANLKPGINIFGVQSTMPDVPANTNGSDGSLTVTIPAGYADGVETTTAVDSDLVAGNIKNGINIFGILGTYLGSGLTWFGSWIPGAFGLIDYVYANSNEVDGFDNHYGLYESVSAIYAASFVTLWNGASNDDKSWLVSILKIDKTTFDVTIYRSTNFGIANWAGASPDAYFKEDSGILYFGYETSTATGYIEFDTATDTFGWYWATTNINCSVVMIGNPSTVGWPIDTVATAGAAPGTVPPVALPVDWYEYGFLQLSTADTYGSDTVWAAITFLLRYINIYDYNNIGIEVNNGWDTSMLAGQFFFKPDGTSFYVQNGNSTLRQYDLSTPWDLSTYSFINQEITGVRRWNFWRADGLFQYAVLGQGTDRVYRNAVSPAWDVTWFGAQTSYNPSAECNDVTWVWLKDDGTKMYLLDASSASGFGGTGRLYQYSLSTPRQISAGVTYDTISLDFSLIDNNVQAIAFSTDGTKLFVCGAQYNTIFQYNLSVAWDLSTATYDGEAFKNISTSSVIWMAFRPDMSYAYVANNFNTAGWSGNSLLEYIQA